LLVLLEFLRIYYCFGCRRRQCSRDSYSNEVCKSSIYGAGDSVANFVYHMATAEQLRQKYLCAEVVCYDSIIAAEKLI